MIATIAAAGLATHSPLHAAGETTSKPNIILITADDLGMQLSCYGDPHIRTPHIDALAASGTRFKTAYVAQASCSPSRVSIFTGLYPHTHGHIGLAKPANPMLAKQFHEQTLPALLKASGYRSAIIGKLRWLGVTRPGLASDAFVSSVDILPTIVDAVGAEIPAHVQGRSLRKVGAGDNTGWRDTLAAEFHMHGEGLFFPIRALRDERHQIIHNLLAGKARTYVSVDGDTAPAVASAPRYNGTPAQAAMALLPNPPEWELYDLRTDPHQFQNLAYEAAHADTLRRMQHHLVNWRQETNDPFLNSETLAAKHAEVNNAKAATK